MLAGASNFTISGNARLYDIRGDAVINQFAHTDKWKKIQSLPHAQASQKDYETSKKSGPCFPGTRKVLLQEMMGWVTNPSKSRMYVLSGLAGIGKSTVVYTLATQADEVGLLGASFFFSRDDADRSNAKKFFSTIAYQLCSYNEAFADAIAGVLLTDRGSAAATHNPQEQLKNLILDPLRSIVQSCAQLILVIVDALDECDEDDERAVFDGLCQLVRELPSFKVILTTRPQPLADYLLSDHDGHNIFHLEDIEDKIVNDDIRLYLSHSFSQKQVRERLQNPKEKWCASDEDIESLVEAAGRLFIIASTAVLYVLNKVLGNPGTRMKRLLDEIAQDRTPFQALNHFYSVIVRSVIQVDNDVGDTVERYQNIVGTIVVVQTPLPVTTLASLIGEEAENVYAMLRHLQSVILLGGDDVPRVYHKSFIDYLTDAARCEDGRLRIDTKIHHTQMTTWCFKIMDKCLKYNILDLGIPARFMSNEDGLKKDLITNKQLEKKIPQELRYACVYWVKHLAEDINLTNGLGGLVNNHMLHWIEVLSLIGKLDLAHRIIGDAVKLVKSTSSGLFQLLSDALRFIAQFYAMIERSALHTYYSALPFTPTKTLFYRQYIKEAVDNIFVIEDGPEKWDALVAYFNHEEPVNVIKFSLDNSLFVSWSEEGDERYQGKLKIWDAITGTPISMIPGHKFAINNDFSTVASSEDRIISYYNVNGSARGTMFTTSSTILQLVLSSESNRIAAALDEGTVLLWNSRNSELIDNFDDSKRKMPHLRFSPTGTRLAYLSSFSNVKLRHGISGRFITDLECGRQCKFEFSGDGSRIVSLSRDRHLRLWNSENGALIDDVREDVAHFYLEISPNGSLLATAAYTEVQLWSENNGHLARTDVLERDWDGPITFSEHDILAITTRSGIKLYNVKTRSFITALPFDWSHTLAFSPHCTHLAVADHNGRIYLWDIRSVDASSPLLKEKSKALTALVLSRDCSRLAYGFEDGTVDLWRTDPTTGTKQRISPLHSKVKAFLPHLFGQSRHQGRIIKLRISPDGKLLASGSDDKTIKLWNAKNGSLRGTFKVPGVLHDVALSNHVLVAGGIFRGVTLWNLDTPSPVHIVEGLGLAFTVSIAENSALIAIATKKIGFDDNDVYLFDVMKKTTIITFNVPHIIRTMSFLPNNSHLVAQSDEGVVLSLNLVDKHTIESTLKHFIQLPDTPFWHGIPIWLCKDKEQHYLSALFPQHENPVPVLWIPKHISVAEWTQGSSMIALGCKDGRVIFLRLHTSCVS